MSNIFVFIGPTLPAKDVTARLGGCTILPPAAAGDFLKLPAEAGDVVGLVDGYFRQQGAIRHKEILALINRGVRVLGAASMGALRAAELHPYGMAGVGRIFDWYCRGAIDGDDEVALVHLDEDESYAAVTLPLVNLRHDLDRARAKGVLSARAAADIVLAAQSLPYHDRDLERIFERARTAGVDDPALARFDAHLKTDPSDLKRLDALALLDRIREGVSESVRVPIPDVSTVYHVRLERAVAGGGDGPSDQAVLDLCRVLHPRYPQFHRQTSLTVLAALAAEAAGVTLPPAQTLLQILAEVLPEADLGHWLRAHRLGRAEIANLLETIALAALGATQRHKDQATLIGEYLAHIGVIGDAAHLAPLPQWTDPHGESPASCNLMAAARAVYDEARADLFVAMLKISPGFPQALEYAAAADAFAASFVEHRPDLFLDRAPTEDLLRWAVARWDCVQDFGYELLDRGFRTERDFSNVAYRLRLYAELIPSFASDLTAPEWLERFALAVTRSVGTKSGCPDPTTA